MLSVAPLPAVEGGLQTLRHAATARRWRPPTSSSSQLRCSLFPLGERCDSLLIRWRGPSRVSAENRKRRIISAVLQGDDLHVGSVGEQHEEQELKSISSAEEVKIGFEEVGDTLKKISVSAGMESKVRQRVLRRKGEQKTYLFAAIASSTGFTTLAVAAVVYRFVWQMPASGEIPYAEVFGTFSLAVGAAIGMEFWARWAHKALWHASLWNMHESHHRPRDGPFETNDVFAIINAVPAISLMLYGFLNKGIVPGLCFGAGLGITMFGIAYMFVHDGLVHRRFPVGPIAGVPYLQKVAAAHQLHHADMFEGVPYGLFLGPQELEKVGGKEELEKLLKQRSKPAAAK
ncbi:unnamed protein product [Calypogeia fissa]